MIVDIIADGRRFTVCSYSELYTITHGRPLLSAVLLCCCCCSRQRYVAAAKRTVLELKCSIKLAQTLHDVHRRRVIYSQTEWHEYMHADYIIMHVQQHSDHTLLALFPTKASITPSFSICVSCPIELIVLPRLASLLA